MRPFLQQLQKIIEEKVFLKLNNQEFLKDEPYSYIFRENEP